jgi:hypothetical protein
MAVTNTLAYNTVVYWTRFEVHDKHIIVQHCHAWGLTWPAVPNALAYSTAILTGHVWSFIQLAPEHCSYVKAKEINRELSFQSGKTLRLHPTTLCIMTLSIMTLNIITFSITTFSITSNSIMRKKHNDTRHNGTQYNDNKHNDTQNNDTQHNDTHHYDTV